MNNLFVTKGEKVLYKDVPCIIIKIVNISTISIEEIENHIIHTIDVSKVEPLTNESRTLEALPTHYLSDKDWEKAKEHYKIIKPIINNRGDLSIIKQVSDNNNISIPTLYRWVNIYEESGLVSSLAGKKRTGGVGQSRLAKVQDEIINNKIHSVYLTSSRKSITKTIRAIQMACIETGVTMPHANTIRNRIKNISEEERIYKRLGAQEAKYKFEPHKGHFPGADYPLSVVQIDHTPVDIILVDELNRKPLRRPWLTVAIDVYSRLVAGFYLSFDTPGALGTGICISNAILPKEIWMEKLGVNTSWPCWGVMDTIHVDNGKEFRGHMLKRACQQYGINLQFRPIRTPHWGGHVERLLGTFSKEIHNLPGTTFSSEAERKNYQSEKNASFTISEFEKWLTIYITNIYHKKHHSSIGMSPLEKYQEGILGTSSVTGRGIPPRINDERRTRLDFMPYVERTIQEYGIVIDHIYYYDDVLRSYIHDTHKNKKVQHIFKRDPRDISKVFFYDPKFNDYYEIPYRNTSLPAISIWEHNVILETLKKNKTAVNEEAIFSTYKDLEELENRAIRETKKRRRNKDIDRESISSEPKKIIKPETFITNKEEDEILPFEDLEDEALK